MPLQVVVDEYTRYVLNEIPIRLIDLRTMELVDRGFIRRHFSKDIEDITESMLFTRSGLTRIEAFGRADRLYYARSAVKKRVKYAILSHRWLEEGEPTYQEMSRRSGYAGKMEGGGGPGYEKLTRFCEEARRHGFEFAWSDTCCIDKTSSVELDESIRSMFRWYRNATLCIVHLAQTTSLEDLEDDEWLKRGWTLQELLAPRRAKFFNREWIPLLTDSESERIYSDFPFLSPVVEAIGRATGISTHMFNNFYPNATEVDQTMSWAAKRRTTREEDMAYCLMGIFDVSIQIAYGEGASRALKARTAFHRLVEAIMLKSGDPSVLNFRLNDNYAWERHLQFHCPLYGINDIVALYVDSLVDSGLHQSEDFGLGIINYIPATTDAMCFALPEKLVAYILHRKKLKLRAADSSSDFVFVDYSVSGMNEWRRVMTDEFIVVDLPMPSDRVNHRLVDHSLLQTVYL